jgi:hypothetical protein
MVKLLLLLLNLKKKLLLSRNNNKFYLKGLKTIKKLGQTKFNVIDIIINVKNISICIINIVIFIIINVIDIKNFIKNIIIFIIINNINIKNISICIYYKDYYFYYN